MNTLETLIAARELITPEENWTQRAFARDAEGVKCTSLDKSGVCFCSIGAINKVLEGANNFSAYRNLSKTIGDDIMLFNDTHTHAEVLAVFDATIIRLQNELTPLTGVIERLKEQL